MDADNLSKRAWVWETNDVNIRVLSVFRHLWLIVTWLIVTAYTQCCNRLWFDCIAPPPDRFLNKYRLIVKEIPWNFGGNFIKIISPKINAVLTVVSKDSAPYRSSPLYIYRDNLTPMKDENLWLNENTHYFLNHTLFGIWKINWKQFLTSAKWPTAADRHFKSIFSICQKVWSRMTYWLGLYTKQFVELCGTMIIIAWESTDMRPTKCVEMRWAAACVEMWVAGMLSNRDLSARNRDSTHWQVLYLYGTDMFMINGSA